jgi:hypothetical protein
MTIPASRWLLRWKWVLVAVGLPVLVGLWWAFRPEKLWVNQKVNEAAPFDTSAGPRPVLTGRFDAKTEQASGRATIYQKPGGEEYLHLSDFSAPKGEDLHVELKGGLNATDLGPLKYVQGDQNYDVPAAADPNKYVAVVIYGQQSHTVLGLAKLEPF